ncbi:MAG: MBL fold metallo-hydrolase [Bacteroidales bacterium]|nr:MBL fold metallo-hydrolase [Bacteroidales bacterium]
MKRFFLQPAFALALALTACGPAKDVEVGPYTVSVIGKNIYHIQDYNSSNPAGEEFDADGKLTHFNNCSDIYLLVGKEKALMIDLSNPINWAENAEESLRSIVAERIQGKPLTIAFTHEHGDHTGMLPAFINDPEVRFALPNGDFAWFKERYPEANASFFNELGLVFVDVLNGEVDDGMTLDLGGMKVEAISCPGHTNGSMVYLLKDQNLLFTGDAVGSGHGVWIFNENGFNQYVSAVPYLIQHLKERNVDLDALKIYGGHYWQKDWLNLPKGTELGMDYLLDMKELLDEMEAGTAATELSNLGRPGLETYFRHGQAIVTWSAEQLEKYRTQYPEPFVYRDGEVVFRRIDDRTLEGNGFQVYNESVYLLEGDDKALLIDAGAWMPHLAETVAKLTDKPVTVAVTHGHGDHVGGIISFPEVWINFADMPMIEEGAREYGIKAQLLSDGDVIDLGGRQIEVLETPGHTSGSITFFDKDRHYGFSGDAFGSTNLLLFTNSFRTLVNTLDRTIEYMQANGIEKLYPGHYHGDNPETLQRLLDEKRMSEEVLSGKRKGVKEDAGNGLNSYIFENGVYIRYNDPEALQ